jgi:hypothetical protein
MAAKKNKRGGKRPNAGRKKREITPPEPIDGRTIKGRIRSGELIEKLNALPPKEGDPIDVAGWRRFWDSLDQRIALDTRKYLHNQHEGEPVKTINHVHDKPIDLNVNVSMADVVRQVRERKQQYERSRNKSSR